MATDGEHAEFYRDAAENKLVDSKTDYYVCQICGHIQEDFIPENCPVCHAVPGRFKRID